jgi:hypothetical protein
MQTLERREHDEHKFSLLQNEIAQVEKRTLQYGAGFMATLLGLLLTAARVFNFKIEPSNGSGGGDNQRGASNGNGNSDSYNESQYAPPPMASQQQQSNNPYNDVYYMPPPPPPFRVERERASASSSEQPGRMFKPDTVSCPVVENPPRVVLTAQELVDLASMEFGVGAVAAVQRVGGVQQVDLDLAHWLRMVQDSRVGEQQSVPAQQPRQLPDQQQPVDSMTPQVRV